MSTPSLEALFERYRAAGDLEALGTVFDRAAPDLLRLAAHLVGDPVEAEDLLQATFVAAIEGARSFDGARRLEPWLAGILARQAARSWRRRGRALDPRRLGRAVPADPGEQSAQRELHGLLAQGLEALGPGDRVVLERYAAGERPHEIARAEGRAPGAVRMQLLRGLERLRRVLPAGLGRAGAHGLGGVFAPRGLDALRAEVLGRGAALAAGSASAPVLLGVLSMKLTLAGLAALVVTVLLLTRGARGAVDPAAPAATATLATLPVPNVVPPPAEAGAADVRSDPTSGPRTPAAGAPEEPRAVSAAARRPGVFLIGDLLGLDALDPAQVTVVVRTTRGESVEAQGQADGSYAADITTLLDGRGGPPVAVDVEARHPLGRRTSVAFALPETVRRASHYELTEERLDLWLLPRTAIRGRVRPPEGTAADEVSVALVPAAPGERSPSEPLVAASCDAEGGFLLCPEVAGAYAVVARARGVPPAEARVQVAAGEVADAGVIALGAGGVAIEGQVRLPFPGSGPWRVRAALVDGPEGGELASWNGIDLRALGTVEGIAATDARGAFRIEGLAPGHYAVGIHSWAPASIVLPCAALTVAAPASGVVLGASYGRLDFTVRAQGALHERIQLAVTEGTGTIGRSTDPGEVVTVLADRGASFRVRASAPGFRDAICEFPALARGLVENAALVLEPDTELAGLRLTWTVPAGARPPELVTARLVRGDDSRRLQVRAEPDGCLFEDLPPGRTRVTLEPCGEDCWELAAVELTALPFEVVLEPGRTRVAAVEWLAAGTVRFEPDPAQVGGEASMHARVLDALGRPWAARFVRRRVEDGVRRGDTYDGAIPLGIPTELLPKPAPGSYVLVLSEGDAERARLAFEVVAGQTTTVPLALSGVVGAR